MNTGALLEQLLRSRLGSSTGAAGGASSSGGLGDLLGGLLGGGSASGQAPGRQGGQGGLGDLLGGLLGGATQQGRPAGQAPRGGSGGLNLGSLATLGMLAYQAYSAWQRQQGQTPQQEPQTVNRLMGAQVEEHSTAILQAMIAAAKADGRIDAAEQQLIQAELAKLTDDPELQIWLEQEVRSPLDPARVAESASSPELAAEMYLASVLLVGSEQTGERPYLDALAQHLRLDAGLREQLEAQVRAV